MNVNTSLHTLLNDIAEKQKKGLPFIMASIFIWGVITVITLLPLDLMIKNISVLSCGALLFPVSIVCAKIVNVDLFYKKNPLIQGLLIATNNQILYLIICILLLIKAPEWVLPVYAIIYGGHLLPYAFFYQSKGYQRISIFICLAILISSVFLQTHLVVVPLLVEIGVLSLFFILKKEIKENILISDQAV
ncbi:DUF7010 family protein [Bacillus ndiopicus]|uniref:DUF7010 family protein n=1 Tax=Bacillus ndiopicus TaxID=1347368 RepID=UPI0005A6CA53|nr:hypothetical protein [Bacillus ndiopicus]